MNNEIERRRTFAIIAHPDAGKTSLTEKLLLFGGQIQVAGAVKSNKIKKTATSDWMDIEKQRGISVTTSVMEFDYHDYKINILDTPGHQDFAEDTYRTLTAVDSVIIVVDGAKGVETQTRKLMEVCRMRNTPVIIFVNKMDAKISLERLNEIHNKEDEEQTIHNKVNEFPENQPIRMENIYFNYDGANRDYILENFSLNIPANKITAIVGASGSGKTTLIKLLLGFYNPLKGNIKIGNISLEDINPHLWRKKAGVVMQEGFIFSDTIANNIAVGVENIDKNKLLEAVKVANIQDFIESLPLKYNTKIGMEGNGISQGQRQRILIARAVYKSPDYIFLDEATNALDTNNERIIMENLNMFYKGRTVVIVAHRLSTVQNADNIVVLDHGKIIEEGTHKELTQKRGAYYKLVKNQLELGK